MKSENFVSTAPSKSAKPTRAAKTPKTPAKPKTAAAKPKPTAAKSTGSVLDGSAPAPLKQQAEPRVVDAPQPVIIGPMMRKKELIEAVVQRSGMKKKDVKPVVETMLAVLGEAIGDNRELNLPPLGRVKIRREKQLSNGRVVVAKIRQNTPVETDTLGSGSGISDASDI
ncbi:hypothetical protein NBRC116593_39280 [Sulfitobacter pacificus]